MATPLATPLPGANLESDYKTKRILSLSGANSSFGSEQTKVVLTVRKY